MIMFNKALHSDAETARVNADVRREEINYS